VDADPDEDREARRGDVGGNGGFVLHT
jgi:hypothetical protein